jgi:sortase A
MDRSEHDRRLRGRLLAVERVLLASAVVALGWYAAVSVVARLDQVSQNRALESLRGQPESARPGDTMRTSAPARPAPPPPRALVGRLEVPRLGMTSIVREGVDGGTLRRAVGHVPETALPGQPGNAALAGHRDTFFRPLKHIRKDDRIRVTTPDGVHEYRVTGTRVVAPTDVSVLAPTAEPTLTLVTCYPFSFVGNAPNRFVVLAARIGGQADVTAAEGQPAIVPAAALAPAALNAAANDGVVKKKVTRKPVRKPVAKKVPAKKDGPSKRLGPWRRFLTLFAAR